MNDQENTNRSAENKNRESDKPLKKGNTSIKSNVIDIDNLPKTKVRISMAIFMAIIIAISGAIFVILKEYFEIKSTAKEQNKQLIEIAEGYKDLSEKVNEMTHRLDKNHNFQFVSEESILDCPELRTQISKLTEIWNRKKCD